MGIEAKTIQVFLLRIIKISFNICSSFAQKHPLISSALLFLFLLYLFLPKAFFFLIYSSPFLACTNVFVRFYLQKPKIENGVKDEKKVDAAPTKVIKNTHGKSVRRSQTNLNRNIEVKKPKIPDDGAVSIEEKQRKIIEEKKDSSSCSRNDLIAEISFRSTLEEQTAKSNGGVKSEMESLSSEEEDGGEGEAKESRNKAVEWTEDDQKNLMDLGISELERNKRLESLIARRRARKLCKMQTEKYLISNVNSAASIPVAPVHISRSNPFDLPNTQDKQIPGSAPSILLPRNPFDLPYDPLEEKPNLMADSFQQEFMEAHQREMLFCRHESFTLGSFPLQSKLNQHDIAGQPRFKKQIDERHPDWLAEHLKFQTEHTISRTLSITDLVTEEGETSNAVKIQPEEDKEAAGFSRIEIQGKKIENPCTESSLGKGRQNESESSSSFLSEDNKQAVNSTKTTGLTSIRQPDFRFPESIVSPTPTSGPCPLPKAKLAGEISYLASPATIDRSSLENHLLYTNNGPWHVPSDSVASDMQVEVSEVGSPPLTEDGSASSDNGDSLTYDGDVEKEITSGSDEMWGVSPHAPKIEEQDLTLNEFRGDNIPKGFLGFQNKLEDPISSSSGIQLPQQNQTNSADFDHKISNAGEQVVEELVQLENSMEGTCLLESSISYAPPQEEHLQKPQETMNYFEKSTDVPIQINVKLEEKKSVEVMPDVLETSIISDAVRNLPNPDEGIISESSNQKESKPLSSTEQLVEVTHSVPETSIISEVNRNLLEPADEGTSLLNSSISFPPPQAEDFQRPQEPENEKSTNEMNISYNADVPVHPYDDLKDQQSVEVMRGVPETSIISVVCDLSEPAEGIISESSVHIESKPLSSDEQSVEEINIVYTTDVPVQTNDGLGDQNSVEVASSVPETSIISDIARDLSNPVEGIISQSSNHPVHTNDDQGDNNSVEVTRGGPETSIISEVVHDLSEPTDERNSERSNQIENKSPNSPKQYIEEDNIAHTRDVPVHKYDDSGDQKSVEVTDNVPETSINSEAASNLLEPASEKSNSLSTTERSAEEMDISYGMDDPAVHMNDGKAERSIEEEFEYIPKPDEKSKPKSPGNTAEEVLSDLSKRAAEETSETRHNSERDYYKFPENENSNENMEEKSIRDDEVSGVRPNSDYPSTSEIQQELTIEQVSTLSSTSSSPKSVLPDLVPLPPSSSDLNQRMHINVSESDMEENVLREKSLDQQLPENSAPTEEMSNTLGKTTDEAAEMLNENEAMFDGEGAKEDLKSTKTIQDEAEKSTDNKEISSRSVEHNEGTSGILSEYEPSINQPNHVENHADSNIPELAVQAEEIIIPSRELIPVGEDKFENLTENRNAGSPSRPDVEVDHIDMPVTVGEETLQQNSATINNGDESQGMDKSSGTMEVPKSVEDEDRNLESIRDTESESRNLTQEAVDSAGENNNSNAEIPGLLDGTEIDDKFTNNTIIDKVKDP